MGRKRFSDFWQSGEENGRSKLTERDVLLCRRLYVAGANLTEIAERLNVSTSCIRKVIRGETWTQVPDREAIKVRKGQLRGERSGGAKLSWDDVNQIRRRYAEACPKPTQASLAVEYGVTRTAISKILNKKTWT